MNDLTIPPPSAPLMFLESELYQQADVRVAMLRLDQLHPLISGNKWFKLHRLRQRLEQGARPRLLSFGGFWSNHLHALAYLGWMYGVETIGVVRGHPAQPLSSTLADAQAWGMRIHFVDRASYRDKYTQTLLSQLRQQYGDFELIPEGGSSVDAISGCREIWNCLPEGPWREPHLLALAVGTGSTLSGLLAGKPAATQVLGVPVIKADERLPQAIGELLADAGVVDPGDWCLADDAHGGGYARLPSEWAALMRRFEQRHGLPLDPVYTVKLVAAINRRIVRGEVAAGTRVVLLHTGGLQGRRGMSQRIAPSATMFTGPLYV